jgi:hypothetical protein
LGQTRFEQDIKKALELASVCEHPNAVWLTKMVGGRDVASREETRQVFLGCETIQELLALLLCLEELVKRFVELRILEMRLPKHVWQGKLVKILFNWRKNLLLKENAKVVPTWMLLPRWNRMRENGGKSKRELFSCR